MKGIGLHGNGFPVIKENAELVKENIKRILLTLPGENVGNLEFGSRVREFLFNFDFDIEEDIEQEIISSIGRWEPRVIVLGVTIEKYPEMTYIFRIKIDLALVETYERLNLELPINF